MSVTDTPNVDLEREREHTGLFGIDLGFQDKQLEVVDPIVVAPEQPLAKRAPRTLTDHLAKAAADRARWGRSA